MGWGWKGPDSQLRQEACLVLIFLQHVTFCSSLLCFPPVLGSPSSLAGPHFPLGTLLPSAQGGAERPQLPQPLCCSS